MSQASKYVNWCLKKAQREIEECKEQGLSPKHRGLLKRDFDVEAAKRHLDKAEHDFRAGSNFFKNGFPDWSVNAFFYSMYQCFLAIASKFGYESGNQTCTVSLMEYLNERGEIRIGNKFFNYFRYENKDAKSVIELREKYTYGTDKKVDKSLIDFFMAECRELLDITREVIFK